MMKWLLNRNTATKLMLAFTLVGGLAIVVGVVGLYQAARIGDNGAQIGQTWLPRARLLGDMRSLAWRRRALALERIDLSNDPTAVRRVTQAIDSVETALNADVESMKRYISKDEEQRVFMPALQAWQAYLVEGRRVTDMLAGGKVEQARAVALGSATSKMEESDAAFQRIVEANTANVNESLQASARQYSGGRAWIIGVLVAVLLTGLLLSLIISGAISRQIAKAMATMERLAAGDVTTRADVDSTDEIGRMARALNGALDVIQSALRDVRDSADTTLSAAQQLQAASQEISAGAQEQATSLEETAASLEEMTASVRQNSDHAQQADQLAVSARDLAERGGKVVLQAVDAMAGINDASHQIAEIILTIDEIAFQTNILALNAAVEAARAGQQGRGFAVVAGEVRTLAQRSAAAAKEIKALIQNSSKKVEVGRELVHRSGESLQEIVTAVKRVSDIVGDMAAASREQASGIEQVNRAITQMDSVTQSNASQTEELASTAEALASQAEQLQGLVGRFKVDEERHAPVRRLGGRGPAALHFHDTAAPGAPRTRPARDNGHLIRPAPSRMLAGEHVGESAHAALPEGMSSAPVSVEPVLQLAGGNGDAAGTPPEPPLGPEGFKEY